MLQPPRASRARLPALFLLVILARPGSGQYGEGGEGGGAVTADGPPPPPPVVSDLRGALADEEDPDILVSAATSLGQFDPEGTADVLGATAADPKADAALRSAALVSLGRQEDAGNAAAILPSLGDPSPLIRRHALMGLGLLRSEGQIAGMAAMLSDPDPGVRQTAAISMAFSKDEQAVARLVAAAANDADKGVRMAAIKTLAQIGGEEVPDLLGRIAREDPEREVRELASETLTGIARAAEDEAAPEPGAGAATEEMPESACLTDVPAAGEAAESGTTAVPGAEATTEMITRSESTANGESGHYRPGEPIDGAIARLAARLQPDAGTPPDERLRVMHSLSVLADQSAFLGSRTAPMTAPRGRWYLTAHEKLSEHEDLVKSTFVNEAGALFRFDEGNAHLPGSSYIVFRFENREKKPGQLVGIGAYTYSRAGEPIFKHFGLDGKLDTFSTRGTNAKSCFSCHNNEDPSFKNGLDFTFDTFEKARESGVASLMEDARTRKPAPITDEGAE